MSWTVGDAYDAIDAFAPFASALDGDNVGLLIGHRDRPVDTILTALDATSGVVREAVSLGAQLLVTHHPLMFAPRKSLNEAEPEAALLCDIIRANLSMIAAHTNVDIADGGVNDALVAQLGLKTAEVCDLLRFGMLETPMTLDALARWVAERLDTQVTIYGSRDRLVSRFSVCCGAGGGTVQNVANHQADVLITGEIKHDQALDAIARGLFVLAAGHRATETCAADLLAKHLQSAANGVQFTVNANSEISRGIRVFVSRIDPFS